MGASSPGSGGSSAPALIAASSIADRTSARSFGGGGGGAGWSNSCEMAPARLPLTCVRTGENKNGDNSIAAKARVNLFISHSPELDFFILRVECPDGSRED